MRGPPHSPADAPQWQPYSGDSAAVLGTTSRWLDSDDDIQSNSSKALVAPWLVLDFPQRWPEVFKESANLKSFINKQLRGKRCRAVGSLTGVEAEKVKCHVLRPLHSFENAERLSEAFGWRVVKGFHVSECLDEEDSYVAIRHWWNECNGRWLDATPSYVPPVPGRVEHRVNMTEDCGKRYVHVARGTKFVGSSLLSLLGCFGSFHSNRLISIVFVSSGGSTS